MIDLPLDGRFGDDLLLSELLTPVTTPAATPAVALRGGRRFGPAFAQVTMPSLGSGLRAEGVYLITGGLGAVGLQIAGHLARSCRARLALVGRGGPGPAATARIEELRRSGAQVSTYTADVSDPERLSEVVGEVRARYGALHGVLHLAFQPGGGLIALRDEKAIDGDFAAKAAGAIALAKVLATADLDWLVLFSSLNAYLGGHGAAAYAGACTFVDRFAAHLSTTAPYPVTSINWGLWRGLADEALTEARRRRALPGGEELGITVAEGLEVLDRILAAPHIPQVVVTPINFTHTMQAAARRRARPNDTAGAARSRPALSTEFVAPAGAVQEAVAEAWRQVLGIDSVGAADALAELGGDSLAALQILSRLRDEHGWEISLHDLFATPTIAGVAALVERASSPPEADADLAAVLHEIESMSPEEIERTLGDGGPR